MRCDMFQYLHSRSTSYGYWEMPPLLQHRGEESTRIDCLSWYHLESAVQWRSSRQDLLAKSTCEAELIASSEALQQGENVAIVVAEMTNKSREIEGLE